MHIYKLSNILIPNNTYRYEEYDLIFKKLLNIIKEDLEDKIIILNGNFHNRITSSNSIKKSYDYKKKILDLGYPVIVIDGENDFLQESNISYNDSGLNNCKIIYLQNNEYYEYKDIIFYIGEKSKDENKTYIELKEDKLRLIYHDEEDEICGYKLMRLENGSVEEKIIIMNNDYLEKGNKREYIINDKIETIREILLNKNVGEYIYERNGSDDIIYKSMNSKKYSEIYKEYVEKKIEKIKKKINWNMKLGEWNLLKEIIIDLV